jgi:hypothetical protein
VLGARDDPGRHHLRGIVANTPVIDVQMAACYGLTACNRLW